MFSVTVFRHGDLVQNLTLLAGCAVRKVLVDRRFRQFIGQVTAPTADLCGGGFSGGRVIGMG